MASNEIPLGKLAAPAAQRDAVHVAIAPMTAGTMLRPGERVCIIDGKLFPGPLSDSESIGVVDPFMHHMVKEGQRTYLLLDPNTITGMRHHWQHPAFEEVSCAEESPAPNGSDEAIAWLKDFAEDTINIPYDELIEHLDCVHKEATRTGDSDHYIRLSWDTPYDDMAEMWTNYGILRNVSIEKVRNITPFTCSC
jgi:hypothetical protein